MSEKVWAWSNDGFGMHVRYFVDSVPSDVAAIAREDSWSAFMVPSAKECEMARGPATSLADAMAKADAQLREWGLL